MFDSDNFIECLGVIVMAVLLVIFAPMLCYFGGWLCKITFGPTLCNFNVSLPLMAGALG